MKTFLVFIQIHINPVRDSNAHRTRSTFLT